MSASLEHMRPAPVTPLSSWSELNRQWLVAAIRRLRERIEALSADGATPNTIPDCIEAQPASGFLPALIRCAETFGLSPFERELLLLVAGLELDQGLRAAVGRFNTNGSPAATYGLALAVLTQSHWDALSPERPLRRWRIVESQAGGLLTQSVLRLDERILHFIAGIAARDAHLEGMASLVEPPKGGGDAAGHPLAQRTAALLDGNDHPRPVVVLHGGTDATARRDLVLAALAECGRPALWIAAHGLAGDGATLSLIARHLDREHLLTGAVPALSVNAEAEETAALDLIARMEGPALWLGTPAFGLSTLPLRRRIVRYELPKPGKRQAQARLATHWQQSALGESRDPDVDAAIKRASEQFHLTSQSLEQVIERLDTATPADRPATVWAAAREAVRGGLEALAQRIDTRVTFDDLVLPSGQTATLRDIARHLRHRDLVYEDWEFGRKHQLGQGLVALFAGEPGTGKTLAAEAIASEVELDLYRVDLASTVSKYIGETEKNLKRLFDAAEASGAVLLFDEADALFGKRSEVKDSHDRYANIEVAYLLQRVEAYRGLAILTTNMKSALDRAFLRRIRFVVTFPFPDMAAREQIWRKQFPPVAPLGDIDFVELSRLNLAGGHIRSVALAAAFKAAEKGSAIDQELLIAAAREEFAKMERNFSTTVGGRP
ncbi:ATP-binding protein [Rhizobium sp. BK251]|uniref:ATP-binding protein n=1 Tax=Rhizobium sp. BK251 TaxID=2512125 RepID=UPI0010F29A0B|nr:ATP-binding protein [Rhizobium sp. BK251]TCL69507.1 ATPase family protein associated with various cellular activities (AAA) [Rhizobium sp. BK251]